MVKNFMVEALMVATFLKYTNTNVNKLRHELYDQSTGRIGC